MQGLQVDFHGVSIMKKPSCTVLACPIETTFQLIGKKWTVLLIRDMTRGLKRFNQFLASIAGLNPKTLAIRLKEMEKNGIIERKIIASSPVHTEYLLTEKGKALWPILDAMANYSTRWNSHKIFSDEKPRTFAEMIELVRKEQPELLEEWERPIK